MVFSKHKTGLVGRNGAGKSTLIKLILSEFRPASGAIHVEGKLAAVPHNFSVPPAMTIAGLLGYEEKLHALQRILQGSTNEHDFSILNEEWDIEERMQKQLAVFGLNTIPYSRQLVMLSGGEITRLLLVKAFSSGANFLLLDEPTNHLDRTARQQLYNAIQQWQGGLIVVSHDRMLLNLMEQIIELTTLGAACYGGNYDAYAKQKSIELAAEE